MLLMPRRGCGQGSSASPRLARARRGLCLTATCVKDLGSGLALRRRYGVAMARPLQMAYPGALYHISTHGNAQRKTWGQGLTLPYPHYPKRIALPRSGGGSP